MNEDYWDRHLCVSCDRDYFDVYADKHHLNADRDQMTALADAIRYCLDHAESADKKPSPAQKTAVTTPEPAPEPVTPRRRRARVPVLAQRERELAATL